MLAVEVENLTKSYAIGEQTVLALRGVSFSVAHKEYVGIVGESGSGKSTLLHILGTLDTPSSGLICIDGKNPFVGSDTTISTFRNKHVGFVFQHNNLLPEFTALENVMMPALIAGENQSTAKEKAHVLLKRVRLGHRESHFPSQLSGGEQQRVAIARSLVNNPVLVLADEPSGNLDSHNAAHIHDLFREINDTLGATILVVTHSQELAKTLSRTILMRDGVIVH
jgi:lipoprotein-releasing system ATP-binding protein